ncbi:MAG: ABC transporter substrate-binding protein [Aestuariivirgaceae bacterium]|jgi:ABC-type transporter MlaC component
MALSPIAPSSAATCPASAVAERAGNAMIVAAKAGSPAAFSGALRNYADMSSIALFALGKYRKSLPAGKQAEFVALTTDYVSRTLNDFRLKFRAESIAIRDCSGDTIESVIFFLGGKGNQPVLWRIKGSKVADVNVQNVWLAQLLRTNITGILDKNDGNFGKLFDEMKK